MRNRFFIMLNENLTPLLYPTSVSEANRIVVLEEGNETHTAKSYAIGIDCPSKFIQVRVLAKRDVRIFEYCCEFSTVWNGSPCFVNPTIARAPKPMS